MSVYGGSSSERFLRPVELGSTPRNYRRLQARRLLMVAANALLLAALAIGAYWLWQKTRDDVRFAVRNVDVAGAVHVPRAELDRIVRPYLGANLFRLDLEGMRADLRALPWIDTVALEKKLPNTLSISIVERQPAALVSLDGKIRYVDRHGVVFAELSPAVGDPDLPLIADTRSADVGLAVALLENLRTSSPDVYSRISQVAAVPPAGFTLWDRDLRTVVRINGAADAAKWPVLYEIARAERWTAGTIDYADLRFERRIVIKPRTTSTAGSSAPVQAGREAAWPGRTSTP